MAKSSRPIPNSSTHLIIPTRPLKYLAVALLASALVSTAVFHLPGLFLVSLLATVTFCLKMTPAASPYDVSWWELLVTPAAAFTIATAFLVLTVMFPGVAIFPAFLVPTPAWGGAICFFTILKRKREAYWGGREAITDTLYEEWFERDRNKPPITLNLSTGVATSSTDVESYSEHCVIRDAWLALDMPNSKKLLYIKYGFTCEEVASGAFDHYTTEELAVFQALRGVDTADISV